MAIFSTNQMTTAGLTGVPNFIVEAKALDVSENNDEETKWYFSDAQELFGYYFNTPEIHNANNALNTWAFGRGWDTVPEGNGEVKAILDRIDGNGFDSFESIIFNLGVTKNTIGDSFAEIIWNKEKNIPLNLIPISPERVCLVFKGSRLQRYEVYVGTKEWRKVKKEDILHLTNNRIGDEMHGTSKVTAAKRVIDALNEAFDDTRTIMHRMKALGIVKYKTTNAGKISYANSQIEKAVKNGDMVGIPEDTADIEPFPDKSISDRLADIAYLENKFYQIFGVPRSIASSDGTSEVGGKMGHVIFEPIYTKEQKDMERALEKKLGIKVKFKRPPSLGGMQPELDESKNTGQINIQPNDVTADIQRE